MNSIFEEELLAPSRARMMMPSSLEPAEVSFSISTDLTYRQAPTSSTRKRTVPEAINRARSNFLFRASNGLRPTPFAPYAMLFQGLTYGLILLDPGNRLEGGLID